MSKQQTVTVIHKCKSCNDEGVKITNDTVVKCYDCNIIKNNQDAQSWFEIKTNKNITIYRRNIQKSFIEKMSLLMKTKEIKNSDLFSIIRGELIVLKNQLTSINKKNINLMTRYHYDDCLARIKNMLNPNK